MLTDKIKLRIPLVGKVLSKTAIARFTRTLGTLIEAGVPILEALNITRNTSGNEVFARAIGEVHDSVREGETFADPLRASKVCDPIVVNMVDVGEETGDLDKMLLKVADNYDEEVDATVAALVSVIEPVMVVLRADRRFYRAGHLYAAADDDSRGQQLRQGFSWRGKRNGRNVRKKASYLRAEWQVAVCGPGGREEGSESAGFDGMFELFGDCVGGDSVGGEMGAVLGEAEAEPTMPGECGGGIGGLQGVGRGVSAGGFQQR